VSDVRQVVIAVFDGVEVLDVTGPASVFSAASKLLGRRGIGYRIRIAASAKGPVRTSTGVQIVADATLAEVAGTADTVVLPGAIQITGDGPRPLDLPDVVRWVARGAPRWRRIASVCTGAYLLAEAGLLDGRRATTHWYAAEDFARRFPAVTVDHDPIFIRDGPIWTSAGVTAGMDLALALVADDHGEEHARTVARWLVMYLRRPGGQSQFSVPLSVPAPRPDRIRDLLAVHGNSNAVRPHGKGPGRLHPPTRLEASSRSDSQRPRAPPHAGIPTTWSSSPMQRINRTCGRRTAGMAIRCPAPICASDRTACEPAWHATRRTSERSGERQARQDQAHQ
jgi:transcriptional regulator GlxA family with amidase domain